MYCYIYACICYIHVIIPALCASHRRQGRKERDPVLPPQPGVAPGRGRQARPRLAQLLARHAVSRGRHAVTKSSMQSSRGARLST